MQQRTLDGILNELIDEKHLPMVSLVKALMSQPWIYRLRFDLSMLRLWVAREGRSGVEAMIAYGDGRGGGRPLSPYVDAYEFTSFVGSNPTNVTKQNLDRTLDKLKAWLDATDEVV